MVSSEVRISYMQHLSALLITALQEAQAALLASHGCRVHDVMQQNLYVVLSTKMFGSVCVCVCVYGLEDT